MVRAKFAMAVLAAMGLASGGYALSKAAKPPKGYLVAEVKVTDPVAYKDYATKAGPIIAACGGKYLARGGRVEGLEGAAPAPRFVIVKFNSFEAAKACYWSKAYQAVAPIRQKASESRFWLSDGLAG
jgi:uncharacterized protein (DUF1330 family)